MGERKTQVFLIIDTMRKVLNDILQRYIREATADNYNTFKQEVLAIIKYSGTQIKIINDMFDSKANDSLDLVNIFSKKV